MMRNATSRLLAQLMPTPGGLASVHSDDGGGEALGVALVARHPVRLAQADEPLVPVELPDDLAVPHPTGVEEVDVGPVHEGGPLAAHRIEVPVDRIAEGEAAIAEQVEAPGEHRFRLADERRFGLGRMRRRSSPGTSGLTAPSKNRAGAASRNRSRSRARAPSRSRGAHPRADGVERSIRRERAQHPQDRVRLRGEPAPVEPLAQLLHAPSRDLRRPHAEEPGGYHHAPAPYTAAQRSRTCGQV